MFLLRRLFTYGSVLLALVYLISCLTPFLHPTHCWPLTFLALAFPVIAACVGLLSIAWLFVNRLVTVGLLALLALGYKNIAAVVALNTPTPFNYHKKATTLRLLSWNVRGFDNNARHHESEQAVRRRMINFIRDANADVLMLQEYMDYQNASVYSNTSTLRDTLGYKYYYTSRDIVLNVSFGPIEAGSAIFSKYPLTDTARLCYPHLQVPECAISASLVFNNKPLRLVTTHFASMNLKKAPLDQNDPAYSYSDSLFIYTTSRFTKLKHYGQLHSNQANALKQFAGNGLRQPLIVSGDLNAVSSSYAYHTVRQGLQDCFIEKGWGLGRTYAGLSPTLRIDYLLASKHVRVVQYTCPRLYLSDHFPLIADLDWR